MRLGIPLFGSHPDHAWLGTKQGSRQVFLEEDVPHPQGFEVADRRRARAGARASSAAARAIAKLNEGVSGLGNAQVDLTRLDDGLAAALELEDTEISVEEYLEAFDEQGGIVEELVEGADFRSPSVQIRMSPAGQVDILSTHDQVLGGPHGQTYFGCHFPADHEYAARLAAEGLKVGRRLAREGVLGRAAVDFVAVRDGGAWRLNAVEINLRCGGTTHPFFALQALTDGVYDPLAGEYRTRFGDIKHYAATDHLDSPAYRSLTPDDLLDVVADRGLGWDAERETGVALHMVSALAVAGRDRPDRDREHPGGGAGAVLRREGRAGRSCQAPAEPAGREPGRGSSLASGPTRARARARAAARRWRCRRRSPRGSRGAGGRSARTGGRCRGRPPRRRA